MAYLGEMTYDEEPHDAELNEMAYFQEMAYDEESHDVELNQMARCEEMARDKQQYLQMQMQEMQDYRDYNMVRSSDCAIITWRPPGL
jgi:hypothetical protein